MNKILLAVSMMFLILGCSHQVDLHLSPSGQPASTPVSTPTPVPTVTPTPTPSPTPVITPVPTATPIVVITPTPTPLATATPTPGPVITPVPTATPVVVATPTPSALNITLSAVYMNNDMNQLELTGTGFTPVKTVQLIKISDGSIINNMEIIVQTNTMMILKATQNNVVIDEGDVTLRLL